MPEKKPSMLLIIAVAVVTVIGLIRVLSPGQEASSTAVTVMSWIFILLGAVGVVGMLLTRK